MAAGSPVSVSNQKPASQTTQGPVKQGAAVPDSTAVDAAGIVDDFNTLLASLRAAGVIASS